jgi:hypothetical protein
VILPRATVRVPAAPLLLLFLQRNISYAFGYCPFVRRKKKRPGRARRRTGYNTIMATLSSLS